jgi:ankyrin repeat protein
MTPLHHATMRGDVRMITELLLHGAHINALDSIGMTPLHWACERQHKTAINALIEHGADVNACEFGWTPLDLVASERYGKPEIMEDLLRAGAKVDGAAAMMDTQLSSDGSCPTMTPLHRACLSAGNGLEILLTAHADPNKQCGDGMSALFISALTSSKFNHGFMLQHKLESLIKAGAEVDLADEYGTTPLAVAVDGKDARIVDYLIAALLENGASVNFKVLIPTQSQQNRFPPLLSLIHY